LLADQLQTLSNKDNDVTRFDSEIVRAHADIKRIGELVVIKQNELRENIEKRIFDSIGVVV